MDILYWIIIFSLLGGVLSVIAASAFLLIPEASRNRALPHAVSFAIGALLGAAFLALLPHAMADNGAKDFHQIGLTVLIGILVFFVLEKMVLWRHCHSDHCEAHTHHEAFEQGSQHSTISMILIGDGLHNFVDGILIAAAFLTDIHLGIVTSIAVATHEIPQEVGDFAILLHSGLSRTKALLLNILSSLTTLVGAILAYAWLQDLSSIIPTVLAIAASSFIYIAMADLLPNLHKRTRLSDTLKQLILIVSGIVTIYMAHSSLH
ncbi:MAG TPA: ZIP family metal transporter [Gammaproteobacteria bacterium]|nr:ZIP family metal transporter [Gammaproteobacteria bacterium]